MHKEMKGARGMESEIKASGFVVMPRLKFKSLRDQMLFQYFLSIASYSEYDHLDIGQAIVNISELCRQVGWTRKEIIVSLDRLESSGHIDRKPLPNNKGTLLTICFYEPYQDLKNYKNRGHQDKKEGQQKKIKGHQEANESVDTPTVEGGEKTLKGQQVEKRGHQGEKEGQLTNITAFINSITNINKTLKEYLDSADVKSMNLTSIEDVETFVDFAMRTNALPSGVSRRILISYFDSIRLTRQTCNISANILANFIEKAQKFSANQINYSLWKHVEQHDDKKETYTLGILRNTTEPEARRGLIKLKNKNGGERDATPIASNEEFKKYDFGF